MVSDTGKSIDDYRNIIKTLKLKLKRAENRQLELEEFLGKINENKKNITPQQLDEMLENTNINRQQHSNQETKEEEGEERIDHCQQSLERMFKSAAYLGLSLESLFRGCDIKREEQVTLDAFRIFLQKVKLHLSQSELSSVLYVLDEDCSGIVHYIGYVGTLAAYGLSSEPLPQQVVNIQQESVRRYLVLLKKLSISQKTSYDLVVSQQDDRSSIKQFNLGEFFKSLALKSNQQVSRREKSSLWQVINYQKFKGISQETYLEVLEKYDRQGSSQVNESTNQNKQNNVKNTSHSRNPSNQNKNVSQHNRNNSEVTSENIEKKALQICEEFQQNTGKPISYFLESLLLSLKKPKRGILLFDLEESIKTFGSSCLTQNQLYTFFRYLDSSMNPNGCIYYDDLSSFYNKHRQSHWSVRFYAINLAKQLQAEDRSTIDYMVEKLRDCGDIIDRGEFNSNCRKVFNTDEPEESEQLWEEMFGKSVQEIDIKQLQTAIDQYRTDVSLKLTDMDKLNKQTQESQQIQEQEDMKKSMLKSQMKLQKQQTHSQVNPVLNDRQKREDDKKFSELLSKIKSTPDGRFIGDEKTYSTIFTDKYACLKKCQQLRENCLKTKNSWIDPEFGPNEEDPDALKSLYFAENMIPLGCPEPDTIEWLPISTITSNQEIDEKPCFFKEGASSNDVLQSEFLGNCWFVSSLSIVATHDYLLRGDYQGPRDGKSVSDSEGEQMIKGTYPPLFHYLCETGIYVIRFFKQSQWLYVIIDDTLPVLKEQGTVVYGQCRSGKGQIVPTEYWVSLIEKAYAKVHNCYQALFSGYIDESLQDLTGLATEKRDINLKQLQNNEDKDRLWHLLSGYMQNNSMMGCSADGPTGKKCIMEEEDTGLIQGHAYAVLDLIELKDENAQNSHKSHRLIRLRNPWGKGEWKLEWSEDFERFKKLQTFYPMIQQYYKEKRANSRHAEDVEDYAMDNDDGTFLMRYKDWRTVMDNLYIAIDFEDKWFGLQCKDAFREGQAGGLPLRMTEEQRILYSSNPQYLLTIDRKDDQQTQIFINLSQKDGRLVRGIKYPFIEVIHPIVCYVYKMQPGEQKIEIFDQKRIIQKSGPIKPAKDICVATFGVSNGRYMIIPSTKINDSYGEFKLKVYMDCGKNEGRMEKLNDKSVEFSYVEEEEETVKVLSNVEKEAFGIRNKYIVQ